MIEGVTPEYNPFHPFVLSKSFKTSIDLRFCHVPFSPLLSILDKSWPCTPAFVWRVHIMLDNYIDPTSKKI
jgi:hypothetical protein